MSDFYKRFLLEDVPKAIPGNSKQVFLGAFGKHPGWDDHVEDLGLETESLITAKMLLYVKGIGGQIDAGAWEKLDESQLLPAFKHIFVWQRSRQLLIGRMWASTDGKGRARYPMVVCAHYAGVPLAWALEQVLPALEQLEQICVTTNSAQDVRKALNRARTNLREGLSRSPDTASVFNGPLLRDQFVHSPQFGPDRVGLLRILYQMSSQFAPFASGRFNARAVASTMRPQHLRTPWGTSAPDMALLLWSQLLQTQVDLNSPVLIQLPLQEAWLDITVGEITREEMFCLRATPKAVPLTSEVPYNLEESFRQNSQVVLDEFVQGRRTSSAGKSEPITETVPSAKPGSGVGRFWKWLGGAGVIFVLAVAALLFIPPGEKQKPSASSTTGTTPGTNPPTSTAQAPPTESATKPLPVAPDVAKAVTTPPNPVAAVKEPETDGAKVEAAKAAAMKAEEAERARLARDAQLKQMAEAKAKEDAARKAEAEKLAAIQEKEKAAMEAEQKARQAAASTAAATLTPATTAGVTTANSGPLPPGSFTNSIGMVFVRLPAGYWAGQTEVTEEQFRKIMPPNHAVSALGSSYPVHLVTWNEAVEFCKTLTAQERQSSWLQKGWVYALPTESQWSEFVGNASLEDAVTSFKVAKKRTRPEPVASVRPNRLSLFDVRGNVWEWCLSTNNQKVARGGAFNGVTERTLEIQATWTLGPDGRREDIGFRCVMVPER